jgi:hypothetical protein
MQRNTTRAEQIGCIEARDIAVGAMRLRRAVAGPKHLSVAIQMPKSLYFQKQRIKVGTTAGAARDEIFTTYGVQARVPQHKEIRKRISLRNDLEWREVQDLQELMKEADFWESFPEPGLRLVTAEVKAGDEPQRIDLLYLRDDGGIIPCELKVGGTDLDTHGQLLRYMADLSNQAVSREWVITQRRHYLARKNKDRADAAQNIRSELMQFEARIGAISNDAFRLLDIGIIVDEGFPQAMISAVAFLNRRSELSLRLIRLDTYVADDWTLDTEEYVMRIDLNEIPLQ